MVIGLAETPAKIKHCFPVMRHLRPALIADEFVSVVQAQQAEGFVLAYLEDEGAVRSVAGFRVQRMLATGRTMYVDDLVTDPACRSRGYGRAMLRWLMNHGREAGCETFSLDSGTQRQEAHAFYFRERMRITSFHFARKL